MNWEDGRTLISLNNSRVSPSMLTKPASLQKRLIATPVMFQHSCSWSPPEKPTLIGATQIIQILVFPPAGGDGARDPRRSVREERSVAPPLNLRSFSLLTHLEESRRATSGTSQVLK